MVQTGGGEGRCGSTASSDSLAVIQGLAVPGTTRSSSSGVTGSGSSIASSPGPNGIIQGLGAKDDTSDDECGPAERIWDPPSARKAGAIYLQAVVIPKNECIYREDYLVNPAEFKVASARRVTTSIGHVAYELKYVSGAKFRVPANIIHEYLTLDDLEILENRNFVYNTNAETIYDPLPINSDHRHKKPTPARPDPGLRAARTQARLEQKSSAKQKDKSSTSFQNEDFYEPMDTDGVHDNLTTSHQDFPAPAYDGDEEESDYSPNRRRRGHSGRAKSRSTTPASSATQKTFSSTTRKRKVSAPATNHGGQQQNKAISASPALKNKTNSIVLSPPKVVISGLNKPTVPKLQPHNIENPASNPSRKRSGSDSVVSIASSQKKPRAKISTPKKATPARSPFEEAENVYTVETILAYKRDAGAKLYLVKWQGYPEEESTWEPLENLLGSSELVDEFERTRIRGG